MKVLFKILLSLVAVVVVGFGARYFLQKNILPVKSINISFKQNSNTGVLLKKLEFDLRKKLSQWEGQPIFKINLPEMAEQIEIDKRVQEVQIRRRFPRSLDVLVTARRPELLLLTKQSQFLPVSHDANLLPALDVGNIPSLPVLRGWRFHKDKKLRLEALKLVRSLPEKGSFSVQSLSEVHFSKKDGFILYLIYEGTKVKMGFDEFKKKAKHVNQVIKYLDAEDLKGRLIDARYSKKVVVKLKK